MMSRQAERASPLRLALGFRPLVELAATRLPYIAVRRRRERESGTGPRRPDSVKPAEGSE